MTTDKETFMQLSIFLYPLCVMIKIVITVKVCTPTKTTLLHLLNGIIFVYGICMCIHLLWVDDNLFDYVNKHICNNVIILLLSLQI